MSWRDYKSSFSILHASSFSSSFSSWAKKEDEYTFKLLSNTLYDEWNNTKIQFIKVKRLAEDYW